jgi:hypothetical protein
MLIDTYIGASTFNKSLLFVCYVPSHYMKRIDLSPYEWNFDLDKSGQKFHHSLKERHKISNIPKFRCEML